jgi:DNA-binding transcriptional regulator YiaG
LPFSRQHEKVRKPLGIKYNDNPNTLSQKIRNRRLELQLRQRDIARILKVSEDCITNWENNLAEPRIQNFPAIIAFLGYNPFAINLGTLGGRIKQYRILGGLSHRNMGKILKVDASTIGTWEKNMHYPQGAMLKKLLQLLKADC